MSRQAGEAAKNTRKAFTSEGGSRPKRAHGAPGNNIYRLRQALESQYCINDDQKLKPSVFGRDAAQSGIADTRNFVKGRQGRLSEEEGKATAAAKSNRIHSIESDRSKSEMSPTKAAPADIKSKKGPQSCTSALSALNVLKDKVIRIVLLSGDQK